MRQLKDILECKSGSRFWEGEYESDDGAEVMFKLNTKDSIHIVITNEWSWGRDDLEELKATIELIIKDID